MMRPPRPPLAIVVCHEASLTGAPRMAGVVARVLRGQGLRTRLVLRWGGPLEPELRAAADTISFEPFRRLRAAARRHRLHRTARIIEEFAALVVLIRRRPALVWANTTLSACWIRPATRLGVPIVLHVHELEPLVSTTLGRYRLDGRWPAVQLVGCSTAVVDNLARLTGVQPGEVEVLQSLVDQPDVLARANRRPARTSDGLVVGGCGVADPRKGFDLFLAAAQELLARAEDDGLSFRWVGRLEAEACRLVDSGVLDHRIQLIGEVPDGVPELAAMDIVVVPSRVDPFPLVVLEAMTLGRPIVASAVDGIPEQVGDAGLLFESGDLAAMTAAIDHLVSDDAARRELGEKARVRAERTFGFDRFEDAVGTIVERAAPGLAGVRDLTGSEPVLPPMPRRPRFD